MDTTELAAIATELSQLVTTLDERSNAVLEVLWEEGPKIADLEKRLGAVMERLGMEPE